MPLSPSVVNFTFKLADVSGNPITGKTLSQFTTTFTLNGVDITLASQGVSLSSSGGTYSVTYTPTQTGFYRLTLYEPTSDITTVDEETIVNATSGGGGGSGPADNIVEVTQDYISAGHLKPSVADPLNWVLYVIPSYKWHGVSTPREDAVAATTLDSQNNWVVTPITMIPGTYHFVLFNNDDRVIVSPSVVVQV